jgi:hypothetical protein
MSRMTLPGVEGERLSSLAALFESPGEGNVFKGTWEDGEK